MVRLIKKEFHEVTVEYGLDLNDALLRQIYPDLDVEEASELPALVMGGYIPIEEMLAEADRRGVEIEWSRDYDDWVTDRKGGYEVSYDIDTDDGESGDDEHVASKLTGKAKAVLKKLKTASKTITPQQQKEMNRFRSEIEECVARHASFNATHAAIAWHLEMALETASCWSPLEREGVRLSFVPDQYIDRNTIITCCLLNYRNIAEIPYRLEHIDLYKELWRKLKHYWCAKEAYELIPDFYKEYLKDVE